MNCCNGDCNQGRKCQQREAAEPFTWDELASSLTSPSSLLLAVAIVAVCAGLGWIGAAHWAQMVRWLSFV
jgi:hypothetical protein